MMKKILELGLVYKFTIIIVCILIVPTFLVGEFYYQSYKQSLYEDADKKLEESINKVDLAIDSCLNDADSALGDIEYSQELLYFTDEVNRLSEHEISIFWESIQENWINIRQIYPNLFSYMNLYSSNEQIYCENNWKFSFLSLKTFESMEEADTHQTIWYGNAGSIESHTQTINLNLMNAEDIVLPVYLNIRNLSSDKITGIVELYIPFDKVIDARNLPEKETGVNYIFSVPTGEIIYQTEDYGKYYPGMSEDEGNRSLKLVRWKGKGYRITRKVNEKTGIVCTVLLEEDLIVQSAKSMLRKVSIVAIAAILLILLMTYLVIQKMLNRLVVLDKAMQQVETGNFQIRLEKDKYNDEISRMKRRFQQMADRLQDAIYEIVEREKAQSEAELRALQAQINPHFLFNTIETMRMQCEIDRYYKIGNALMSLSEIFRYTIRWKGYEVPFRMEWQNLQNYLSLMKLRFDDDFSFEIECCDEHFYDVMVPKMFLQPLAENSFQHGFKGVPAPWKMAVYVSGNKEAMIVRIVDNGGGVPPERFEKLQEAMRSRVSLAAREEQRQSIGIINVLQRIDRICKKGSDISVANGAQGGIEIEVRIVLEEIDNVSDIGGRRREGDT